MVNPVRWSDVPMPLLLVFLSTMATASIAGGEPVLIHDYQSASGQFSSAPHGFTEFRDAVFFIASDPIHGNELWKTDGTASGTELVVDTCPGACQRSEPTAGPGALTPVGGRLFFAADDPALGRELWITDGTAEGTRLWADLCPGRCDSDPDGIAFGDLFVFSASDASGVRRLWASDATREGARELTVDCAGDCGVKVQSRWVAAYDRVLFAATDSLWKTDGTAAGTSRVARFAADSTGPLGLRGTFDIAIADPLAFFTVVNGTDVQFWKTDGRPQGTQQIASLTPPNIDAVHTFTSTPADYASIGEQVFFLFNKHLRVPDGLVSVCQLWKTDGTGRGTSLVTDLPSSRHCRQQLISNQGRLYFSLYDQLWTSDGSAAGTNLLANALITHKSDAGLVARGDEIFFVGYGEGGSQGLWKTDGTAAGTRLVANPGPRIEAVTQIGDRFYFRAWRDGMGLELFHSDGTSSGTDLLANLATDSVSSNPIILGAIRNRVWVSALDGDIYGVSATAGREGDLEFLHRLRWPAPIEMVVARNTAFFTGDGLWRSDGTAEGTFEISDFSGFGKASNPSVVADRIWFAGDDGTTGLELWREDESSEEAHLVQDILPGDMISPVGSGFIPRSSMPAEMTLLHGETVLLTADSEGSGRELWTSNGTDEGTARLKEIWPGETGSDPTELTRFGPWIFFAASEPDHGREIWRTDGTAEGTVRFADLLPGHPSSNPTDFTIFQDRLFFVTGSDEERAQVWAIGADLGTPRLIVTLEPANISDLTVARHQLFFAAATRETGRELWVSDGTSAGTHLVRDIFPGRASSNPVSLTAVLDRLVFTASDGKSGHELWQSDGTAEGTFLLLDLWEGPGGSSPASIRSVGFRLLFTASTDSLGRDLWSLSLKALLSKRPMGNPKGIKDLALRQTYLPQARG